MNTDKHVAASPGHGWVIPRSDGAKARCGGPAVCNACKAELTAHYVQTGVHGPVIDVAPRPAEPLTGWQSIETAPKDQQYEDGANRYGPYILAWHPHYSAPIRVRWWWRTDSEACNFIADGGYATFPKSWMPLPEPPQ